MGKTKKWYDTTLVIIILIIIFPPLGIFLLIKNIFFPKKTSGPSKEITDKYFIPTENSTKEEILSNLSKGVFLSPRDYYKGVGGVYTKSMIIDNERVQIVNNKGGLVSGISKILGSSDVELFFDSITSIKFSDGGTIHNGYISLMFPGKRDVGSGIGDLLSDSSHSTDPYNLYFNKQNKELFTVVKDALNSKIRDSKKPQQVVVQGNSSNDIPEQIKKLNELKEQGILTDEEFNTKKGELLGKM